jgi:hypothetical protein
METGHPAPAWAGLRAVCRHLHVASFTAVNDGTGGLKITDPPVIEQQPGNAAATTASDTVPEVRVPDSGKVTLASSTDTLWLDEPATTPRKSRWFVFHQGEGGGRYRANRAYGLLKRPPSPFAFSDWVGPASRIRIDETARARTPFHRFKCVLARIAAHVEKVEGSRVPGDLSVDPERYTARGEEDETKTETHGTRDFLRASTKRTFHSHQQGPAPGAKP